jgi:hypothetical protein
LRSGESQESIFGSEKVEVDLFFRAREPDDPHTASTWASEYFHALHGIDTYVCLAGIFNFERFMRVSLPCFCAAAQRIAYRWTVDNRAIGRNVRKDSSGATSNALSETRATSSSF